MKRFDHGIRAAVAALALLLVIPAGAQENLDQGKTAVQLFASDCAICHKAPQALGKAGGLFGLEIFLRQHYTASRESAAAISKYLQALADAPPPPVKRSRRSTKSSDKDKSSGKKPADTKSGEAKSKDSKPAESKPAESKPAEVKPADKNPSEAKSEPKTETKTKTEPKAEPKAEPKTEPKAEPKAEPKSEPKAEPKSEAKPAAPAKPEKSD